MCTRRLEINGFRRLRILCIEATLKICVSIWGMYRRGKHFKFPAFNCSSNGLRDNVFDLQSQTDSYLYRAQADIRKFMLYAVRAWTSAKIIQNCANDVHS